MASNSPKVYAAPIFYGGVIHLEILQGNKKNLNIYPFPHVTLLKRPWEIIASGTCRVPAEGEGFSSLSSKEELYIYCYHLQGATHRKYKSYSILSSKYSTIYISNYFIFFYDKNLFSKELLFLRKSVKIIIETYT